MQKVDKWYFLPWAYSVITGVQHLLCARVLYYILIYIILVISHNIPTVKIKGKFK